MEKQIMVEFKYIDMYVGGSSRPEDKTKVLSCKIGEKSSPLTTENDFDTMIETLRNAKSEFIKLKAKL